MRIRMLTGIAGAGFVLHEGEETDRFSNEEAIAYISRGYAQPVTETTIETTALEVGGTEKRVRAPRTKKPSE